MYVRKFNNLFNNAHQLGIKCEQYLEFDGLQQHSISKLEWLDGIKGTKKEYKKISICTKEN